MGQEAPANPYADEMAALVAATNSTPPAADPPAADPPTSGGSDTDNPPTGDPPANDPPVGDPPVGDPPPAGSDTSGASDADLVEVEGKKYFYHPDVHAKGEETHPNSYATRDDAELAAIAKVEQMRELSAKLKEKGKSILTLQPPSVIGKNLSKLDALTEEDVIAMDSKSLQGFLKESDQFIKRAKTKAETVEKTETRDTLSAEYKEKLTNAETAAKSAIQTLSIDLTKQYSDPDSFFADLDNHIKSQVDSKLKKDIDDLAAFKKDEDKYDELGPEKFANEVERRINAIAEKRVSLTQEFQSHKSALKEYLTLKDQGDKQEPGEVKPTPEQILQRRAGSWEEFQADLGHLPLVSNKEKSRAFYAWATRNADQFSNLQAPDDFVEAYEAYGKYLEVQRAKHRKEQLEKAEADKRAAEEREKDIPKPSENRYQGQDRFTKMNKELEDLAAASNKYK